LSNRPAVVPTTLPIEFSRDAVVINEAVKYDVPVLPESTQQLNRTIDVRKGAALKGPIFGRKVNLAQDTLVGSWVFGEDLVKLEASAKVSGTIVSKVLVEIQYGCVIGDETRPGNIISPDVRIGKQCKIFGNIIARDSLQIDGECVVSGIICCTGKEVRLGQGVICTDLLGAGEIKLMGALGVKDSVIWAGRSITSESSEKIGLLSNLAIAGENPRSIDLVNKESSVLEVNLNYDKVSLPNPKSLLVRDEVLRRVQQALS
jgi:predicted acyltransferase (DUF342 family)